MKLKSRHEVLEQVYAKWDSLTEIEEVSLDDALGRISAENVFAQYSVPVVRASAMDGVAVKSEAFKDGMPDTAKWVRGVDYDRADTGDDFDDAFDAVIAIEQVEILPDGGILIDDDVEIYPGYCVNPAGSSFTAGELMVKKGARLRPEHLACAAMAGIDKIKVRKKPVVAFIPTGSELVAPGTPLQRGQNFESNGIMATAQLKEMGAEPIRYPIIRDDREKLEATLDDALAKADIIVLSGGSSKGEEDFNTHILRERGELVCDGVAAVPGRPMTISIIDGTPVVNTSGPSLAAFYSIDWCIRSLVCSMLNIPYTLRHREKARLVEDLNPPPVMEMMMRMELFRTAEGLMARPLPRGVCEMSRMLTTNGVLITKIGDDYTPAGTEVEVELCCTPDEIPFF